MSFIEGKDTVSAKEATLFITVGGKNIPMIYAKAFDAHVEKEKVQVKTLGRRLVGHKTIGGEGLGNLKIYDVSDLFSKYFKDYQNSGKDLYFDAQVTNEDPDSKYGKRQVLIKGINLDVINVVQFDVDGEVLETETDFTFEDFESLELFKG